MFSLQVALLLKFLNVSCPSRAFFDDVQAKYCVPAIKTLYAQQQKIILGCLEGVELVLAGNLVWLCILLCISLLD